MHTDTPLAGPAGEYLAAKVAQASPADLHFLTIDGAVRATERAREALAIENREAAATAFDEARGFLSELLSGLRDDAAPELAAQLRGLFSWALRELAEAEMAQSLARTEAVVGPLAIHRDTARQLADAIGRGAVEAAPPELAATPAATAGSLNIDA